MILTPLFTPQTDTAIGTERSAMQLRDPNQVFEKKPRPDDALRTGIEWM